MLPSEMSGAHVFSIYECIVFLVGGSQRGFGGVTGAETVLVGRKEMVFGQLTVELLVDCSFYDFGDDWDNGDGTVVGRVGWIARF